MRALGTETIQSVLTSPIATMHGFLRRDKLAPDPRNERLHRLSCNCVGYTPPHCVVNIRGLAPVEVAQRVLVTAPYGRRARHQTFIPILAFWYINMQQPPS